MFGIYKCKLYDFVRFRGHFELITEHEEKSFVEFTKRCDYFIKITDKTDMHLTDIFDVELWVKHDTGYAEFPTEWNLGLDGYDFLDGKIVIETSQGYVPGWKVTDKCESRGLIDPKDIQGAWVLYKYQKKDGVILDEPLVVREDVSLEKLLDLRKYYGSGSL